jgi:hypothetical protein
MLKNEAADRISSSNIVERLKSEKDKVNIKEHYIFKYLHLPFYFMFRLIPT